MLINALACVLVLLVAFKWWKQHLYLARLDRIPGHSSWTRQAPMRDVAEELEGNYAKTIRLGHPVALLDCCLVNLHLLLDINCTSMVKCHWMVWWA